MFGVSLKTVTKQLLLVISTWNKGRLGWFIGNMSSSGLLWAYCGFKLPVSFRSNYRLTHFMSHIPLVKIINGISVVSSGAFGW
jgi:hypothetical protein